MPTQTVAMQIIVGMHVPGLLQFLGVTVVGILFSVVGIYFWPLSLALAATLFIFVGRTLVGLERRSNFSHIGVWLGAGALVGLIVGLAMTWEGSFRSIGGTPMASTDAGQQVVLVAVPTGALAILICRRMLLRYSNAGRDYRDRLD